MPRLTLFAVALLLSATGCQTVTPSGAAVTEALCTAWRESLPTSSSADTDQTALEIDRAHRVQDAACGG